MRIDSHSFRMAGEGRTLLTYANTKASRFAFIFAEGELSRRAKLRRKLEKLWGRSQSGRHGAEISRPHQLSSSAYADDPVRRGLSALALTPVEYWIPRMRGV